MRDYDDDNIRLYTPVLQRIIILVAVIIAVPVVMWTITTFVRTYVAPPKAPTFQRVTEDQPSNSASDASQAASAPAVQQAQAPAPPSQMADSGTAGGAPTPLLAIKKPAAGDRLQTVDGTAPAAAPQIATAAPPPAIQPQAPAAAAQPMAAPAPAAPMAPPPPSGAMADSLAKANGAAPASDHGIVWPNPNTNAPPDIGMDNRAGGGRKFAAQQPQTASDSASEDCSAGEPLAGPIPLPRRRPNQFAMLQTTGLQTTGVPLPRARPADAPAASTTVTDAPSYGYDPGQGQH